MPTPSTIPAPFLHRRGFPVYLRPPLRHDAALFIAAAGASRRLHGTWVRAPETDARFREYVMRYGAAAQRDPAAATHAGLLVCRVEDHAIAGVFNFSEIVRGAFHSAYLGYYAFAPYAGAGYMADGLTLALHYAFARLKLHRIEVNVQPENARSQALIRGAGFVREGLSRRYLRISGRWRDHVRYAMLVEDWRARRNRSR